MPKKKFKDTPEKQYKRFVETAKALEVDESGKAFEETFKKIVPLSQKDRKKRSA